MENLLMRTKVLYCVLTAALFSSASLGFADGTADVSAPSTSPTTIPATNINPRYATPTAVIKTLAMAIKVGDSRSICRCLVVRGSAGRSAVAAFAHISAASEKFSKTAVSALGAPPKGMGTAFGSIAASMDRLMALLPKAVVTIHNGVAEVKFPASATGKGQTIYTRELADGWKVDGARLLNLDRPGLVESDIRHRAKQLNLLAAALNQTTVDIQTGKVTTWTGLEKDMELHILESEAAMDASRHVRAQAHVIDASPPPAAK
jgi:hypothetical protein